MLCESFHSELYFVSSGTVQIVDEHDQVVSVIRSDVPDTAPVVGEVPFFLGINYLKAIKASLEGDVQLQVLNKQALSELIAEFPEDHNTVTANLWAQFDTGRSDINAADDADDDTLDEEKLMTRKRILEATSFRTEQQFNALCRSVKVGDTKMIAQLARQGAKLDQCDYDGKTILHMACHVGRYKVVECLLKLQVQVNIKDRWGQTPMAIALQTKQQMITSVLSSANATLGLASPELMLCTAAGSGDLQQVKRLVEFGVLPNVGDYDCRTAIHVASAEGHEKIVEYLLLSQADPNCKDRWEGTPLQDALAGGHIGTAHLLKAKGAQVPDAFGSGAVCEAAGKGDVPTLRMLHSFGQSLDVGDYDDRYALHLAAAEGRVLAVSFLLGISSDPNKPDR
jgi:ankyrin repeat protein